MICIKSFLSFKKFRSEFFVIKSTILTTILGILSFIKIRVSFDIQGSHCHAMKEKIGVDKRARRKLIIASTLCVLFMIGEIIGKVFFLKSKRNIDSTEKLRKSFVTGDIRQFIVLYICI